MSPTVATKASACGLVRTERGETVASESSLTNARAAGVSTTCTAQPAAIRARTSSGAL